MVYSVSLGDHEKGGLWLFCVAESLLALNELAKRKVLKNVC